ncbi:MAG TPA: amidohydrolase family protein [Candidatus Saccharimonadales bacterium]|jgi:carbamoyl-phosphate synthase/aspartate carbamoyltransferase/dihydroorotase|nr:amidohydrolase family protein [Candidatus Saccharimonadales bacterium]
MSELITLPGLIDPHVHLRDPGQTHKEDFFSGTSAALAGGYTTVLDMPNNSEPITTLERLEAKRQIASQKAVSDIGFHFGTLGDNFAEFAQVIDQVMGLKIYLNVTTGGFVIDKDKLLAIYEAWPGIKPILLHAEEDVSDLVMTVLRATKKPTHMCHVSSSKELQFVMEAKDAGLPITCGVTPHHLFLTDEDAARLGPYGHMKPFLKSQAEQDFLWDHLDYVDVIESDHAPHTKVEKNSDNPPFGVPGLETTLPLMLTAEAEGKLTRRQLLERLHYNPARIFNLLTDDATHIEVDMTEYEVKNEDLLTKAGWSPFAGRRVVGKVKKVVLRGQTVFENGRVLATPGSGRILA